LILTHPGFLNLHLKNPAGILKIHSKEFKEKIMGIDTQPPTAVTLVIAVILWIIGILAALFDVITLPNNLGIWALALAGLLLIIGSLVDNI
jgi:hypothetical protein